MAKQRERSELEVLRARAKELERENRELKKIVGRQKKRSRNVEELEEMLQEVELVNEVATSIQHIVKQYCPNCACELERVDLQIKWLLKCTGVGCKFRKTERKT